jgi:hypothetical protein
MDFHLDGSLWIDTEAEIRLSNIVSNIDDFLFDECESSEGSHADDTLLICQNIDTRASKEKSHEWKDWAQFFSIRAVGTGAFVLEDESYPECSVVNEDEFIAFDDSQDTEMSLGANLPSIENCRFALLQGLVDSVLAGCPIRAFNPKAGFCKVSPDPERSLYKLLLNMRH